MTVYSGSQESKVLFLFGQCPMPNAQCPRTPHLSEKGYISRVSEGNNCRLRRL